MNKPIPAVSVAYARNGSFTQVNAFGMRPMQERAFERRGEQYLLIKSPPASGKSRALMYIALDKLHQQKLKQAIIVVPEKSIGASFSDDQLSQSGFWADSRVEPQWNLCNAPGTDNGGKVKSVRALLDSNDPVLVCTHATFRFAVDQYGVDIENGFGKSVQPQEWFLVPLHVIDEAVQRIRDGSIANVSYDRRMARLVG